MIVLATEEDARGHPAPRTRTFRGYLTCRWETNGCPAYGMVRSGLLVVAAGMNQQPPAEPIVWVGEPAIGGSTLLLEEFVHVAEQAPQLFVGVVEPVARPDAVDVPLEALEYLLAQSVAVARRAA